MLATTQRKVNNFPLVAIIGPTASGKSALGLALAKKFKGFVISADSQQVYKHAEIGTNQPKGIWKKRAKLKQYSVKGIPHFFMAERSLNKPWNVVEFQHKVNSLLDQATTRYSLLAPAFLVGGTGLYVSAIVQNYSFPKGAPNPRLRKQLEGQSLGRLLSQLKKADPATYAVIERKNKRRVVRALEHILTTGISFTNSKQSSLRPNTLVLGLTLPKTKLRRAIQARTAAMWKRGLVNETQYLLHHYPHTSLLNSIGYREVVGYLKGDYDAETCQQLIVTHTWQYTRRQLTWFKRLPDVHWVSSLAVAERHIRHFLSTIN